MDVVLFADLDLGFGPDTGLHFADVGFLEQVHAQTTLADAAANGVGEFAGEQCLVEG